MGREKWIRVSIASITRALLVAAVISASSGALFVGLGIRAIAVPLLLATTIEIGLVVIAVTWRLLTRAHPDTS